MLSFRVVQVGQIRRSKWANLDERTQMKALEPSSMVADESFDRSWIEISSGRLIWRTAIEHLVYPYHQCVRTGNESPFVADSLFEPLVAFLEFRLFGSRRRPCRLHQSSLDMRVPLHGGCALPFSGALIVSRCQPGPGAEVRRRRELFHVWPALGQDRGSGLGTNAGNRLQ